MNLKRIVGYNPFTCAGCGQDVPFDKDGVAFADMDSVTFGSQEKPKLYEPGCRPKSKPPLPTGAPMAAGPAETKDTIPAGPDATEPPRRNLILTSKVGLPNYSDAKASVSEPALPGEGPEEHGKRVQAMLRRQLADAMRITMEATQSPTGFVEKYGSRREVEA